MLLLRCRQLGSLWEGRIYDRRETLAATTKEAPKGKLAESARMRRRRIADATKNALKLAPQERGKIGTVRLPDGQVLVGRKAREWNEARNDVLRTTYLSQADHELGQAQGILERYLGDPKVVREVAGHQVINAYFLINTIRGGVATREQISALQRSMEEMKSKGNDGTISSEDLRSTLDHLEAFVRIYRLHLLSGLAWSGDMAKGAVQLTLNLPKVAEKAMKIAPRFTQAVGKFSGSPWTSRLLIGTGTLLTLAANDLTRQENQARLQEEITKFRAEMEVLAGELERNPQAKAAYERDLARLGEEHSGLVAEEIKEGLAVVAGLGLMQLPIVLNLPLMMVMHGFMAMSKASSERRNLMDSGIQRLSMLQTDQLLGLLLESGKDPIEDFYTTARTASGAGTPGVPMDWSRDPVLIKHAVQKILFREQLLKALVYQDLKATIGVGETKEVTGVLPTFQAVWDNVRTILQANGRKQELSFIFGSKEEISDLVREAKDRFNSATDKDTVLDRESAFLERFRVKKVDAWKPEGPDSPYHSIVGMRMERGKPRYYKFYVNSYGPDEGGVVEVTPHGNNLRTAIRSHQWDDVSRHLANVQEAFAKDTDAVRRKNRVDQNYYRYHQEGWKLVSDNIESEYAQAERKDTGYVNLFDQYRLPGTGVDLYQKIYASSDDKKNGGSIFVLPRDPADLAKGWVEWNPNADQHQEFAKLLSERLGQGWTVAKGTVRERPVLMLKRSGGDRYAFESAADGRRMRFYRVVTDHKMDYSEAELPSATSFTKLRLLTEAMQKLPKVFPRGKVAFIPEQPDGSEWYNLVFQAKIDGIPHDYKVYRRWNDDSDRVAVIQLKDDVRRWSRNPTERKQATLESVDRGEPPYANIADFLKGFQPERSAAHSTSQGDYQPEDIPTAKDAAQPKKSVRKTPRRETRVLDETPGDRQRRIQQELRDTQRLFRGGKRDTDDGILQGFGR